MNIVVLDGFALNPGDLSWEPLEKLGKLTVYDRTPEETIAERAGEAEVLLTNKTPLRAGTIAALPKLKYIGVLATGYDIIDTKAAKEQSIVVSNVPEYSTDSVAQHVFALLLELCHHTGLHSASAKRGDWAASADFAYWKTPLIELSGKTMGIIGFGKIGRRVAQLARAFGMNVLAAGRSAPPAGAAAAEAEGVIRTTVDEVLRQADVVSLHCPLTPQTEGMIDRSAIALMKPGALLINTSRGKLIAENDLAEALNAGKLGGAAVDVLSSEPPAPGNPLLSCERCLVTPHLAWATKEARTRLMDTAASNLQAFMAGKPVNVVG
ncbi:D-2-hydroxyacid dehydrogenase [Paenibacillus ginsengihumi]|uniref:D-2-hydroxyacid dehydrogenase n=1 Tax=Paenibacillus ginsengihumi TaxID=431596 RepID=UPI0003719E5A|nr:D-2-hydroxyacid dehydrogenase [Paenibacillus ginsengihumi]